jgi:hypothetical protein
MVSELRIKTQGGPAVLLIHGWRQLINLADDGAHLSKRCQ